LRRLWGPPEPRPTLESLAEPVPLVEQDYQPIARTQGRRLVIETSGGSFEMALDYDNAPLASERFWRLASAGAFDAQPVAVVRPNGYVQVAPRVDPQPVAWRPEFNSNPFLRGSVGMVRATRDLDSPEFFIALTPLPFIDGRYTNVGRLLSGDDKLDALTTQTRILSIDASR
jgi:cyclophilin family peptidyl-prolyl cis-trans isomerase